VRPDAVSAFVANSSATNVTLVRPAHRLARTRAGTSEWVVKDLRMWVRRAEVDGEGLPGKSTDDLS
jgi:hypothetical protein